MCNGNKYCAEYMKLVRKADRLRNKEIAVGNDLQRFAYYNKQRLDTELAASDHLEAANNKEYTS